ncbi:MAG: hypothetical protein ACI81T_003090, partial [Bacteroidia bacterium]
SDKNKTFVLSCIPLGRGIYRVSSKKADSH